MKRMKIYIVTYKRCDVLNDTLEKLFNSDFSKVPNTEVNIINNHTEFYLRDEFKDTSELESLMEKYKVKANFFQKDFKW